MMKRLISMIVMLVMAFSLSACKEKTDEKDTEPVNSSMTTQREETKERETNKEETKEETKVEEESSKAVEESEGQDASKSGETSYNKNDLQSMLDAMVSNYEIASKTITDESNVVFEKIGDTYDSYVEHKTDVTNFYNHSLSVAKELYVFLDSISIDYFKCVTTNGLEDYKQWNGAMDNFYDTWNDGMDDFYDTWNNIYEDLYDKTDERIESGEEKLSYSEYSDAWSFMYNEYSDSWSEMYHLYSDTWSDIYHNYSDVWSGFYKDNSNVEELIKKSDKENETTDLEETPLEESISEEETTEKQEETVVEESSTASQIGNDDGMRVEFKEAMDTYEAFYNEYCDFMMKYKQNPTDISLLSEYSNMMQQLLDMDEKFKAWENNNLNNEELKYYIEVSSRITTRLLEIGQ